VRNLYAVWSLSKRPSAFIRRLLKEEREIGSVGEGGPEGNKAREMSRGRYSSVFREAGSCIVCGVGDLGEEKKLLKSPVAALAGVGACVFALELESMAGSVGLFFNFPGCDWRSGDASREEERGDADFCSMLGIPNETDAEDPVNQDASPPFDRSSTLITPSRSPVSVGMKPSSSSLSSFFSPLFLSGLFDFVRLWFVGRKEGRRSVRLRWWVRVCRAGCDSSSGVIGMLLGNGLEVNAAAGGGDGTSRLNSSKVLFPPSHSRL